MRTKGTTKAEILGIFRTYFKRKRSTYLLRTQKKAIQITDLNTITNNNYNASSKKT